MAESLISYPLYFEERQEDRAFVEELQNILEPISASGKPVPSPGYILYRIWKDYAHGRSDRRLVNAADLAGDRGVSLLEKFCGWPGERGVMVTAAISAGFLRMESIAGGGTLLVCHGFRESNNPKAASMQRNGGFARALKLNLAHAVTAASERDALWERTGGGAFKDIPQAVRTEAMVFIAMVCRNLGRAIPPDSVLSDGTFHLAMDILREHTEESNHTTFTWLLRNRKDPAIPDRLDTLLRSWPDFAQRAAAEEG